MLAMRDAAFQCQNLPPGIKRVVVPTGSGLVAAGVLAGLAMLKRKVPVVGVVVSDLADENEILENARKVTDGPLPSLEMVQAGGKYGDWVAGKLPDGTALDPYYSATAMHLIKKGDCLWLPGLRPLEAMPERCQEKLAMMDLRN